MRIIVISSAVFKLTREGLLGYGGLEQVAWLQAKYLAERGHEVSLVAPDGSECPGVQVIECGPERITDEKSAYGGFPEKKDQNGNIIQRSYSGYWKHLADAEVVIDHSWMKFSVIGKQEGWLKAPCLLWLHAPVRTMLNTPPPIENACFVAISDDQARDCMAHLGRPARRCWNGVDTEMYRPLSIPRSPRYLFLARFSTVKGPDICLEAALEAGVGLDLVGDTAITGEPELLERCKRLAEHSSPGWDKSKGKQLRIWGGCSRGETVWWFSQAHALLHCNQHFCHLPGQKITTSKGSVAIEDVAIGNKVLSHDGAFHKVTDTLNRDYSGVIKVIQHSSFSSRLRVTPDHPLYTSTPKICACMGESNKAICKPTYGGYQRCRELTEKTKEKQILYDRALSLHAGGAGSPQIAEALGIPPATAYYWMTEITPRPSRDLDLPYCDHYDPAWRPAAELKVGDFLTTPVPQSIDREWIIPPVPEGMERCRGGYKRLVITNGRGQYSIKYNFLEKIPLSDEFLSLCGWYIAEGFENRGTARFALNRDETEHAAEIQSHVNRVFGYPSTIYQSKDSHCQVVIVSRKPLGSVMKKWFGGKAPIKRMPHWMFMLPPDKIKHVIRSMWRGDGCISKRGKYKIMSYTTASPTLAMQLWLTLTKFGIIGYLVEKKAAAKCKNAGKIMYNLNVSGDSAVKLAEMVGWNISDSVSKTGWKGMSYIHNGMIYSRVSRIDEITYDGPVHNLTVDGSSSYLAELVSSHNCEPFGLAPVEAQLCKTAVIAFDNGAMRETVKHGETGFLVESKKQLIRLLKENAVSQIDRDRCRAWAEQFSIKAMIDRVEELCQEAIETGGW